ncbi:type I-E CRISPR-associated endonuclease Cas1e [Pleomorphomonas sp. NRK KF1]|uniref:type I-E CRISPR-associated endonuclease Cas1e n=1 Tax=Pleomorphomonas sp. NRK KF1 TaxID=2943000 RepID=UPI0020449F64|nr:type I-E CRISPR-associated endonuclease Cas1e [Pleomorphomonas sp. NRK KF1]MCM5552383.1 type I-E CRISPR-associated endonuclease Cas1e [Pleomorphomonas sp. NRK KF1]
MLLGRLGLETARLPHSDRHGLVLLDRGSLTVEDGCLRFVSAGGGAVDRGEYTIPHQSISLVMLGPGSTVSHDALRLLARHGAALAAVGDDGVRLYTAPPLMPDFSNLARRQTELWSDANRGRLDVARRMYAFRLKEILPHRDIAVLRGIEGARVKALYANLAQRFAIKWNGRRYDRSNPLSADLPNQAINHAASAVEGAAAIAVTATATIPQLGFIHEDSGQSFVLDIADLFRDDVTIPCAFRAVAAQKKAPQESIERLTRRITGEALRKEGIIAAMIDRIKTLFEPVDEQAPAARARKRAPADLSGLANDSGEGGGDADDRSGDP